MIKTFLLHPLYLYRSVQDKRKWLNKNNSLNEQAQNKARKNEIHVITTLIVTIVAYLILWGPFGVVIILEPFQVIVLPTVKKVFVVNFDFILSKF